MFDEYSVKGDSNDIEEIEKVAKLLLNKVVAFVKSQEGYDEENSMEYAEAVCDYLGLGDSSQTFLESVQDELEE